jgi:hypothetical protein
MIRINPNIILAHDILSCEEGENGRKGYPFLLGTSDISSFTFRSGKSVFAVDIPHQGRCDALAITRDMQIPAQYELVRAIEWPWLWIYDDTTRTACLENPGGGFRIFHSPSSGVLIQFT